MAAAVAAMRVTPSTLGGGGHVGDPVYSAAVESPTAPSSCSSGSDDEDGAFHPDSGWMDEVARELHLDDLL